MSLLKNNSQLTKIFNICLEIISSSIFIEIANSKNAFTKLSGIELHWIDPHLKYNLNNRLDKHMAQPIWLPRSTRNGHFVS